MMGGSLAECNSVEVDSSGVSWCIINNDREEQIAVDVAGDNADCEPSFCAVVTVTYDYPVPAGAGYCEMEFTYDCYHSILSAYDDSDAAYIYSTYGGGYTYADWIGADGNSYLWEDICGGTGYGLCQCDSNDNTWREDSGMLTSSTYGITAFAPAEFRFGDLTDTEQGLITLGPLRCHE